MIYTNFNVDLSSEDKSTLKLDLSSEDSSSDPYYGSGSSSDESAPLPDITSDTPIETNGLDTSDLVNK